MPCVDPRWVGVIPVFCFNVEQMRGAPCDRMALRSDTVTHGREQPWVPCVALRPVLCGELWQGRILSGFKRIPRAEQG